MAIINEFKRKNLSSLGYTGSLNDMWLSFLRTMTGKSTGDVNDLEKFYLGGSNSIADRWKAFLVLNGVQNKDLNDALKVFWSSIGAGAITVKNLFAANEVGIWLDPSDFSTMFQDSAGTTAVTAVGQVVGLMLDKSKGLVLGSNQASATYATPAGFDNVTTSLSATSFTQIGATTLCRSYINITTVIGNWYKVTFKLQSATSGNIQLFARDGASGGGTTLATGISIASGVTSTLVFRATTTTCSGLWVNTVVGATTVVSEIYIGELNGNHATQVTSTARPILQQDANGKYYLKFDGVDDFLVTPSIDFSAINEVSVFAGIRKLSDAARGYVISCQTAGINGFEMQAPNATLGNIVFDSGGSISRSAIYAIAAPVTLVTSVQAKISTDTIVLRANAAQVATSSLDQGTGNYSNAVMTIGNRTGGGVPFNGHLYSLVVRGALSDANQIAATENYINNKTGAY